VAKDTQTVFDNIANIQNQAHLAQQANASLVSASTALAKSISSGQMALDAAVHNAGTTDQQLAATLVEAKKTLTDLKESKLLQGVKTATDLANSAANKAARASVFRTLNLTTALAQKSEVDDVDNAGRRYQLIFSLGEFKDGRLPLHISLTEVGTPNTTSLEKNLITDPIFSVALPGKATDFLYCETDSPQRRRFSRSASVVLRLYAL
jgi:hypothetical protein